MYKVKIEIHVEEPIEKAFTFDSSKMDNIDKQQLLVEIAKMIGFSKARPAYWNGEFEALHDLEDGLIGALKHDNQQVSLGVYTNATVEVLKADDESDEVYIFDTEEQAKQFVEKLTFNKDEK